MMTNVDLEEKALRLNIPLVGVFSKDMLPPVPKAGGYIVNLQDSDKGSGTHWTAFYIEDCGKRGGRTGRCPAVYFDSFGVIPPLSVQRFLRRNYMFSEKHIQNVRSEICGYYVIYFIWFMWNHRNRIKDLRKRFCTFLRLFSSDPTKNKTLLQKYIKPL